MTALEGVSYALFAVYLLSFFGLSAVAARQAGRSIWLFNTGPASQTLPATLFRVAFAGAALWPLIRSLTGDLLMVDPVHDALDGIVPDIIGHLLVAIGACVAAASQMHMGASWRIGAAERETGALVDDGPFAVSRNPVFVGQVLLFIGLFLVFPSIVQGALTAALITAVVLQVRIEERVLAVTLGAPYADYSRRVGRWIGVRPS
ncbi:MAG: methyltransferase family protein [Bosea sp. (in: a-proteobacteria)]